MHKSRNALIIGINEYDSFDVLSNAGRDAQLVSETLRKRDFHCTLLIDPTSQEIIDAIEKIRECGLFFFYFAGHGIEWHGTSYLLTKETPKPFSPGELNSYSIPITLVLDNEHIKNSTKIVVVDACRIFPPEEWRDHDSQQAIRFITKLRSKEISYNKTLIAYSTSSGHRSSDGAEGYNSLYCKNLCRNILLHNKSIEDTFKNTSSDVIKESTTGQLPWYYSSINESHTFSDLSDYKLIQTHRIPPQKMFSESAHLATHITRAEILCSSGECSLFNASLHIPPFVLTDKISGQITGVSINSKGTIAVSNNEGLIYIIHDNDAEVIETKIPSSMNGIKISDDGNYIFLYGSSHHLILDIKNKEKSHKFKTEKSIFSATFNKENTLIATGERGYSFYIDCKSHKKEIKHIELLTRSNLYSCTISNDDNNYALVTGSRGEVITLNLQKMQIEKKYKTYKKCKTPRKIISSLLINVMPDLATDFVFNKETLSKEQLYECEVLVPENNLMFSAIRPTHPVAFCGSEEGIIYAVDLRDNQIAQEIDASYGRGLSIEGLGFTRDGFLVVLTNDNYIQIYYNGEVPLSSAGQKFMQQKKLVENRIATQKKQERKRLARKEPPTK